uniref:Uncharacterized protein n=1 Tax=Mycena chlorophos TaxID=658473 RepID=A0ABQ0M9Q3_MYCCL|nr:predicted protein [Mycena chlorophos]
MATSRDCLERDIRTLTSALCRLSALPRSQPPWKHPEYNAKPYSHIATLLLWDGMGQEETSLVFNGVSMREHFALFALQRLPLAESGIRVASTRFVGNPELSLPSLFESGSRIVDLMTHFTDVVRVLRAFCGLELAEAERESRQSQCLIFLIQRSLGNIAQRLHKPKQLYGVVDFPWWNIFNAWKYDQDDCMSPREFPLKPETVLIFNALSPDLLPVANSVAIDGILAPKCVAALAVLLDVIDAKITTCQSPTRTQDDWEKLNTTLRMLYSLLYDTEILRHIFHDESFSRFLLSRVKSPGDGKRQADGPHFFKKLQAVTAWQRAVLILSSTKIIRAGVPIQLNIVSLPSTGATMVPIMNLVKELYPSRTLPHIKAYLGRLAPLQDVPTFPAHHNADIMGVLMAADSCLKASSARGPRRMWALKECMLQILSTCKSCCYACDKLTMLLTVDFPTLPSSPPSFIFVPWSPPSGTPIEVLRQLREDLMVEFKRHLDYAAGAWCEEEPSKVPTKVWRSYDQLSVLQSIESLEDVCM